MNYTNIFVRLLFLFAFQQIICSQSADDPPPIQIVPRLITPQERDNLLALIKANNHEKIVDFFNDNNSIDYPLIRFQSDQGIHGYTPLAAAIYYCSMDAAKVLIPLQFKYPWTVTLAPRHSLQEIAARYCPRLLIQAINNHSILNQMVQEFDISQITEISFILNDERNNLTNHEMSQLNCWIGSLFDTDFSNQINEILHENFEGIGRKNKVKQSYSDFKIFLQNWIKSGRDTETLLEIFSKHDPKLVNSLVSIELIKSGETEDFLEIVNDQSTEILKKVSSYITVDQLKSFDHNLKANLFDLVRSIDTETHFEYLRKSADWIIALFDGLFMTSKDSYPDMEKILSSYMYEIIRGMNKLTNYAYGYFIQRYPRIDTAIEMLPFSNSNTIKVIYIGTDDLIDLKGNGHEFNSNLIDAYLNDDDKTVEILMNTVESVNISPEELRFQFPLYKLSLIKTAIMLKKAKIFKYLMTRPNASLHISTKHQLTAMEMAACYQPEFLIDHILPLISNSCKQRLRAANNLIAMFRESVFQKCPTGAKNAPIVLPKLITSDTESDVSCINFDTTDAIEEAFKLNFPAELVKAFHATGKYTKNEFYIQLAARRGDPDLFSYFVSKRKPDEPSKAIEEALATWVRFSNGILNSENINMLEFLLKHKGVNLNALMGDSGVSALSLAVQRSFIWIVKRLLLEKDLNINITDLNTLTTPIQHSINKFRNVIDENESSKPILLRIASKILMFFEFDLGQKFIKPIIGKSLSQLKSKKIELNNVELKLNPLKVILNFPEISEYANWIKDMTYLESIPIFLKIFDDVISNHLEKIEAFLKSPIFETLMTEKGLNHKAVSINFVKFFIIYLNDLFQRAFEKMGEFQSIDLNSQLGKYSVTSGLMHNILLSHPSIDTTIENAASIDTLYIVKNRALYLLGDEYGADEMSRTHIRVRNIDAVYDGKKNYKRIIFGVISTLIVGSVSAGIIRCLML